MDYSLTSPKRLRNDAAAEYLRENHGIPITGKTLRNRRCTGTGPACRYFGATPLYEPAELDRWAEAELRERSATHNAGKGRREVA
jgi:hypothetical protein